ncbi:uncharacterized protein LOC110023142 isoform X2 [Phalaenopsis equestris]|uniref:uncharacterized protein LOC110023142 isoform X2 n=1 Tax=Phalaenopsis equestris TaxID=78828 RepID=UPI0009E28F58|nr:uncharacterized protein LOC110023142 isoform X2 [Phalaenopsis equestris]
MIPRPLTSIFLTARWRRLAGVISPLCSPLSVTGDGVRSIHESPHTLEELLGRHLVKKQKGGDEVEFDLSEQRRLTSTRREALCLYRDIIRATRFFSWPDARGIPWRDVLRSNARQEFEEARFERDPEVITRLLIGGRDAVQSALDKLAEAQRKRISSKRESL